MEIDKINFEYLITLLLINRVNSLRNAYSLSKVLAWKFNIIEFVDLIKKMENENLIQVRVIKSISNYEITPNGERYLTKYFEQVKFYLLEKYPKEQDYIRMLF